MQKEIIVSASNVDRAIEKALAQLAMDRDAVSVEVLEMGRKGFLGIGATDARIKVTYEVPDEAPKPAPKPAPASRPAAEKLDKAEKPARPRDEAPRLVKSAPKSASAPAQAAPAPCRAEKLDPADKPRLVKPADPNAPRPERSERPARPPRAERPARPQPVEKPAEVEEKPVVKANPLPEEQWSAEARAAAAFIDGLLVKLGVEGKAVVVDTTEADHIRIEIVGPDMGPVIGRRGDTLDAIQYLASLVLNKTTEEHVRLTIDTENYRVKRAESLERLARKMAGKVIRYHKAMTLEPMNPYERRIIHSALQDYRGVTTHSTGTEPNRRVVISPEGGRYFSGRGGRREKPERE